MSHRLILMLACAALGGCAGLARPDLPVCDGAARRPANPHGSILLSPSAPAPVLPTPPAASPPAPAPAPTSPGDASGGCA
ncbi:hypothetical protein [Brevundimonas sp.]|uniref:hypothetical protein n=1 Tax=Brevundimonas sp. TaxID=1871086 RepID=UPI0024872550|nr:hypothetical protein [Brevundimonas sp.]MDI1281721.1 hypothetical protein [Brevundimonas sp.]